MHDTLTHSCSCILHEFIFSFRQQVFHCVYAQRVFILVCCSLFYFSFVFFWYWIDYPGVSLRLMLRNILHVFYFCFKSPTCKYFKHFNCFVYSMILIPNVILLYIDHSVFPVSFIQVTYIACFWIHCCILLDHIWMS